MLAETLVVEPELVEGEELAEAEDLDEKGVPKDDENDLPLDGDDLKFYLI